MHSFAIHEALYLNYRIPGSAVKDPWVGPIWTYTVDFLFKQKLNSAIQPFASNPENIKSRTTNFLTIVSFSLHLFEK